MITIPTDPKTRRVIASFEGLVNSVRGTARRWIARHRAARAARVASELQAMLSEAQLKTLSEAQLNRLGLTRRA
jgi:hypothetical protein